MLICAGLLAACSTSELPAKVSVKPASKEYFAEAEYGVKASPRVSDARSRLPRGGGRDQVGKPYKVKGKWYTPKEDPDYRKTGIASWYGDAFHGRLTANGEIYDMTHLTAAHPTMPLPSYARVTNTKNGNSLIVRVNDRGPFAHGRIIDLSRRAAELLDYTHSGVAKVEVEYVGRAPLDGRDDQFLVASYRPGNRAPDPSDGLPAGVMIAMNGPTPTAPGLAAAFPAVPATAAVLANDPVLPDIGPIAPERPGVGLARNGANPRISSMAAYADMRVRQEAAGVNALEAAINDEAALVEVPTNGDRAALRVPYVAVGTYFDLADALRAARALEARGRISITSDPGDRSHSVVLNSDGRFSLDDMLRAAWASGASDALIVRR